MVVTQDGTAVQEGSVPSLTTDLSMPNLTVEWARRTDHTVADAEAFQRQASMVRVALGDVEETLHWQLGLALHGAIASGLIAKGKRWGTQEHFAEEITNRDGKGFSKGAVSKAATFGRAAVAHGLEYGSPEYRAIREVLAGDKGTAGERKAVREAIRGEDSDLYRKATGLWIERRQAERDALAQAATQAALDAASGEGSGDSGGDSGDSGESGDSGATREAHGANLQVIESEGERPRDMRPTVGDCLTIIRGLQENLHKMTPEDQDQVIDALTDMVAEVQVRRETLGDVVTGEVTGSTES